MNVLVGEGLRRIDDRRAVRAGSAAQQRSHGGGGRFEQAQRVGVSGLCGAKVGGASIEGGGGIEARSDRRAPLGEGVACPGRFGRGRQIGLELRETHRQFGPARVDRREEPVELVEARARGGEARDEPGEGRLVVRGALRDGDLSRALLDDRREAGVVGLRLTQPSPLILRTAPRGCGRRRGPVRRVGGVDRGTQRFRGRGSIAAVRTGPEE